MKGRFRKERYWLLGILLLSLLASFLLLLFSPSFRFVEVHLYDTYYVLNPIEVFIASFLIVATLTGFLRLFFFRHNKRLVLGFTLLSLGGLFYFLLLLRL